MEMVWCSNAQTPDACATPIGKWLQVRHYRYFSAWFGYGKLEEDKPPSPVRVPRTTAVMYYRALGCTFCPMVGERLRALQQQMGFDLRVVDVTLRPQIWRSWAFAWCQ